jgi:integrase/recombinase XerD
VTAENIIDLHSRLPIEVVHVSAGPAKITTEHIEEFLRQKSEAENTAKSYARTLNEFADFVNKPWSDVTLADVGGYKDSLKQEEKAKTTINSKLCALKSFYRWLRIKYNWSENRPLPTDGVELEKLDDLPPDSLDKEVVEKLCETADTPRDRALLAVLLHGLRASEVAALKREHWQPPILTTYRSKGRNQSKVPLEPASAQVLQEYLDERLDDNQAMFISDRGKPLTYDGIYFIVRGIGERAGFKGDHSIHPHQFRHTFGVSTIKLGIDPFYGKLLMGIKTDKVFSRYTSAVNQDKAVEVYLEAKEKGNGN